MKPFFLYAMGTDDSDGGSSSDTSSSGNSDTSTDTTSGDSSSGSTDTSADTSSGDSSGSSSSGSSDTSSDTSSGDSSGSSSSGSGDSSAASSGDSTTTANAAGDQGSQQDSTGSTDAEGFKLLDGGSWNGSANLKYRGGQIMHFQIKNVNVLGTTITISSNLSGSKSLIIAPTATVDMRFDCFGSEPMGWTFDVSSDSDAFIVAWKLFSSWVPGDPPNG